MTRRKIRIVSLMLLAVTGIALFVAYRQALARRREMRVSEQARRYSESESRRDKMTLVDSKTDDQGVTFDKSKLRGATIRRPGNAFQREDFRSVDLDGATLEAGDSSFQLASFDKASLKNAKLVGGVSSFQFATFIVANLTSAHLRGNFQGASFEKANLTGAKWSGSFQGCNISGANFTGTDLSEIDKSSLESCYFIEAPIYGPDTKVPEDFHPFSQGWQRASE